MFTPTNEQIYINNLIQSSKNVCVEALAGTGKSSTIRYIAQQNKNKNFACLCFNAANAEEASLHPDKPDNVVYLTVHGLAYHEIVSKRKGFRAKLGKFLDYNDLDDDKIKRILSSQDRKEVNVVKKAIHETIILFCRTDKSSLAEYATFILSCMFDKERKSELYKCKELEHSVIDRLAQYIAHHWDKLIDGNNKVKITHDVYLKMYELEKVKIFTVQNKLTKIHTEIHVLIIDEFQDSNPVTLSIFLNQTRLQKVALGDENQTIYSWRGAVGRSDCLKDFSPATLTTSFRFDSKIAELANRILAKQSTLRLIGAGGVSKIDSSAHLCRTNTSVLTASLEYIKQNKKVYANIDIKEVFAKLWHIDNARWDKPIKYPHKDLANITNSTTLDEMLQISEEVVQLTKLSEFFRHTFGGLVQAKKELVDKLQTSASKADITVSTLHKSKGLEWNSVVIDDDFVKQDEDSSPIEDILSSSKELRNLLYVGITRSRGAILLPDYLTSYLN